MEGWDWKVPPIECGDLLSERVRYDRSAVETPLMASLHIGLRQGACPELGLRLDRGRDGDTTGCHRE